MEDALLLGTLSYAFSQCPGDVRDEGMYALGDGKFVEVLHQRLVTDVGS